MGGEHEISDLQIEIVVGVDVEILRLEVPMGKAFVLDCLQTVDELLEVVSGDRLGESSSFGEHDEEVGLVRREHEVGVRVASELYHACVETLDHIRVIHDVKYLFLILCLVNFSLLLLVELHKNFGLLKGWLLSPKLRVNCFRRCHNFLS